MSIIHIIRTTLNKLKTQDLFNAMTFGILSCLVLVFSPILSQANSVHTIVKFEITQNEKVPIGDIIIELYDEERPITVDNFLTYVESGFYNGTIFHRVIKNFMIQGGGFVPGLDQLKTNPPIKNEADGTFKNERGTIAMARTLAIDSATSQFFINLENNAFLDHTGNTTRTFGYCVFGKVISGMAVVDEIALDKTTEFGRYQNVPINNYIIKSATILEYGQRWKKAVEQNPPTLPTENTQQVPTPNTIIETVTQNATILESEIVTKSTTVSGLESDSITATPDLKATNNDN